MRPKYFWTHYDDVFIPLNLFDDLKVYAEPDTFWCFTNLMSEIRDNFIKHLDDSACGIGERPFLAPPATDSGQSRGSKWIWAVCKLCAGSKMSKFLQTLRELDPPLWQKLNDQDIKPQYFAFRWFTILLTQEFSLPGGWMNYELRDDWWIWLFIRYVVIIS